MKGNRPFSRLDRKIRHLRKMVKIYSNVAQAHRDEATYHQAVIDDIERKFNIKVEES